MSISVPGLGLAEMCDLNGVLILFALSQHITCIINTLFIHILLVLLEY